MSSVERSINKAINILTGKRSNNTVKNNQSKTNIIKTLQDELDDLEDKIRKTNNEFDATEERRTEDVIDAEGPPPTHWINIVSPNVSESFIEGVKTGDRIWKDKMPKNGIINKQTGGNTGQNAIITNLRAKINRAKKNLEISEQQLNDIRKRQAKNVINAEGTVETQWIKISPENGGEPYYEGVKGHGRVWGYNLPKNAKIIEYKKQVGGRIRRTFKKRRAYKK